MQHLYTLGFNAHSQLNPSPFPSNLKSWTHTLTAPTISIALALWSNTLVRTPSNVLHYGYLPPLNAPTPIIGLGPSDATSFFGDTSGLLGAVIPPGRVHLAYSVESEGGCVELEPHVFPPSHFLEKGRRVMQIALQENGQAGCTTISPSGWELHLCPSFPAFLEGEGVKSHQLPSKPLQLVAGSTTFTLLLGNEVVTLGSALHPAALGRTPTAEEPADVPCKVPFFGGVPVSMVKGCAWNVAAIGEEGGLYIWGGRRGVGAIGDSEGDGEVRLVELGIGQGDVIDVGVGEDGMLALVEEREVWGCGRFGAGNGDGGWSRVGGPWDGKGVGRFVGVEAGWWGGFVVVETDGEDLGEDNCESESDREQVE